MRSLLRSPLLLLLGLAAVQSRAQVPTTVVSPAPMSEGRFGTAITGVSDVDGDGRGDLLVGSAAENPNGLEYAGRGYIVSGATGAILRTLASPNPTARGFFGFSVAGVSDVDGDGRGDLLIGAQGEAPGGVPQAGRAYLVSGATGIVLRTLVSPNSQNSGNFGRSVASVPDVDGDGRSDLLVGAHQEAANGSDSAGRVYLFSGATGALLNTLVSPNAAASGYFGYSVAGVPDVDGDGRGDLVVGAFGESPSGLLNEGRVYLFSGYGTLLRTLTSPNPEPSGYFGSAVAGVPDADGDSRGDVVVGAPSERVGSSRSGRAYVFSGATGTALHALTPPNPAQQFRFGDRVVGAPDMDGDGRGDILTGAPVPGQAFLLSGATGTVVRTLGPPGTETSRYGDGVAALPNADGAGHAGVIVGATNENVGGVPAAGRVYIYRPSAATATLAGTEGWRLLATPVLTSAQRLLASIRTQGAGGASTGSDGGANVFAYDETAPGTRSAGYAALPSLVAPAQTGRGYAVYVFADDDPLAPGTQGGFPKTLAVAGLGATGSSIPFPVSFTATAAVQEDGWNLVGNPYDAALNWDAAGWVKTRLDNVVYVYDPVARAYKTWNGTAGSLGNGLVPAFAGFWVKASAPMPVLTAPAGARTTEPPTVAPRLALGLSVEGTVAGQTVADAAFVSFHDDALAGLDPLDAYELAPFADTYAALFATADATALDVAAQPMPGDRDDVALSAALVVGGQPAAGTLTLRWPGLAGVPAAWALSLTDTATGQTVDLRAVESYTFDVTPARGITAPLASLAAIVGNAWDAPPVPTPLFSAARDGDAARPLAARFVLHVGRTAVAGEASPNAAGVEIASVQPNPLGRRGTVVVRLAEVGPARVTLVDALGREVAVLADGVLSGGRHEVTLDPAAVAPGVYAVRLQAGGCVASRTVTVVR